jgi:hypothetical protein
LQSTFATLDVAAKMLCKNGEVEAECSLYPDGGYRLNALVHGLKLDKLTGVGDLEGCNLHLNAVGNIKDAKNYVTATGQVLDLKYNGYSYAPIELEGKCTSDGFTLKVVADDPNVNALLTAKYSLGDEKKLKFVLKADELRPYDLHLLGIDNGAEYAFNLNGEFIDMGAGKTILNAKIDNFSAVDREDSTFIRNFYVSDNKAGEDRMFVVNSDFAQVSLYGKFDFSTIMSGLFNSMEQHLPVFGVSSLNNGSVGKNEFYYDVAINNTEPLTHILGLPVTVHEQSR